MVRLHDAVDRPFPEDHVVHSDVGADQIGMRRRPGRTPEPELGTPGVPGKPVTSPANGVPAVARDGERARPSHEERSRAHLHRSPDDSLSPNK
jgi:hypothetical protein